MRPLITVSCDTQARQAEARFVATQLSLPFQEDGQIRLCLFNDRWALQQGKARPISVDFNVHHYRHGKLTKQEGLVRACRPAPGRHILDITAGFACDAAILASFGATLTLVERDPIMGLLLQDGLKRAETEGILSPGQVQLVCDDAMHYLNQLKKDVFPDVIYYDPMHPRSKTSKVKLRLQCLQQWIPPAEQPEQLLAVAQIHVKERVVMKWPMKKPACGEVNHYFSGKTVRFDVYTPLKTL